MRDALLDALAVLLPVGCAGCGADDRALCAGCRRALAPGPLIRRDLEGMPVLAAHAYADVVRAVLLAYKGGDRAGLATALAPALAAAITAAADADLAAVGDLPLELVAVPSTRASRRRRGVDPVPLLLARAGLRSARVFRSARPHRSQKELDREQRRDNLVDTFALRRSPRDGAGPPLAGRRLLLVDDVVTTGATLLAAAATLRVGGAEVVGAVVLAATPRRSRPRSDISASPLGHPSDEGW